jgi:peptidyl-prolyl cis-trans isomerase B (cyclophilin B)
MVRWAKLLAAVVTLTMGLTGCGGSQPNKPEASAAKDAAPPRNVAPASPVAIPAAPPTPEPKRDPLHLSFFEATRRADDPPPEANQPPDKTITEKPVFKILDEVQKTWDSIRFTTADGKKIEYTAVVQTAFGVIEIELLPEVAPNHVRNFVALARAGYYDGLRFDGLVHEEARDEAGVVTRLEQVRAGCPLGTGETGCGSIGYWLKPEFNARAKGVTHGPGTVGAVRLQEPDTAATRFYINVNPAEYLDDSYTIFGKVVKGLDVVRTIGMQPTIEDDADNSRPEKPIVIQAVTIQAHEGGLR